MWYNGTMNSAYKVGTIVEITGRWLVPTGKIGIVIAEPERFGICTVLVGGRRARIVCSAMKIVQQETR